MSFLCVCMRACGSFWLIPRSTAINTYQYRLFCDTSECKSNTNPITVWYRKKKTTREKKPNNECMNQPHSRVPCFLSVRVNSNNLTSQTRIQPKSRIHPRSTLLTDINLHHPFVPHLQILCFQASPSFLACFQSLSFLSFLPPLLLLFRHPTNSYKIETWETCTFLHAKLHSTHQDQDNPSISQNSQKAFRNQLTTYTIHTTQRTTTKTTTTQDQACMRRINRWSGPCPPGWLSTVLLCNSRKDDASCRSQCNRVRKQIDYTYIGTHRFGLAGRTRVRPDRSMDDAPGHVFQFLFVRVGAHVHVYFCTSRINPTHPGTHTTIDLSIFSRTSMKVH